MRSARILITGKPNWFAKDSHSAISFYRILTPLRELERTHGVQIEESETSYGADIQRADIVFLHTPTHAAALDAVYTAKWWGRKIWLDFDDLVVNNQVPISNLAWTFFNRPENKKILSAAIKEADVITVSTQVIKEHLEKDFDAGGKVRVIPNALPDTYWNRRKPFEPALNGLKKMMWRGSVTHEGDVYRFRNGIKPVKGVGYLFVGHLPWLLHTDYGGHLADVSYQPWEKKIENYFKLLRDIAPHYFFVPLENNDFNRAKSNIAWLEATFAGAACIAPDFMPEFANVPTIPFSSPKSLEGVIKNIGSGTDLRTGKYMESRALIESKFLLSKTNQLRLDVLNELL